MAADTQLLQGEVNEDPEGQQRDVERLLLSFLKALVVEQQLDQAPKAGA